MIIEINQRHLMVLLATSLIPLEDYLFLKIYKHFKYYRDFKKEIQKNSSSNHVIWNDDILALNEANSNDNSIDYSINLKIKTLKEMIYDPLHYNYMFLLPLTTITSFFLPTGTLALTAFYLLGRPLVLAKELNLLKKKKFPGQNENQRKEFFLKFSMFFLVFFSVGQPLSKYLDQKSKTLLTPSQELELYYKKIQS